MVLGDGVGEPAAKQIAANVELIYQGTNVNATSELAHLTLPSAVYAEKDGTFTNHHGRVQRIRQALPPVGEARPDWQVLTALANGLDGSLSFMDAESIFAELAAHERAFAGLSYAVIGEAGAPLPSTGPTKQTHTELAGKAEK